MKPWHESAVGYLTDDPAGTYAKALKSSKTFDALAQTVDAWSRLAPDAALQLRDAPDHERIMWALRHARSEKDGEAVAELIGHVLMPDVMILLTMMSDHFKAPWGACFIKAREAGRIKLRDEPIVGWYESDPVAMG